MLKEQSKAPEFALPDEEGKKHSLAAHKGKLVILYFYPKDNTPGCTQEACDFRDTLARLTASDCVVYGISKDSESSHAKFIDKYDLNFSLLSDQNLIVHQAYEVLADNKTIRSTFLIDKTGKIAKVWSPVKVEGHVDQVMKAISTLN